MLAVVWGFYGAFRGSDWVECVVGGERKQKIRGRAALGIHYYDLSLFDTSPQGPQIGAPRFPANNLTIDVLLGNTILFKIPSYFQISQKII